MEKVGLKTRFYKILQGYDHERDVTIREDELERAYGLFMLGGRWLFSGGPVDGKNIQGVVEDYHATMGWNPQHKLEALDYAELRQKGVDVAMKVALGCAKESVMFKIKAGRESEIGKKVQRIDGPQVSTEAKALSEKFKIN
jgi:hypothetical protein